MQVKCRGVGDIGVSGGKMTRNERSERDVEVTR
jgi:hypothetical protein